MKKKYGVSSVNQVSWDSIEDNDDDKKNVFFFANDNDAEQFCKAALSLGLACNK